MSDPSPVREEVAAAGKLRWVICACSSSRRRSTTSTAQCLACSSRAAEDIGWTATQYGDINAAFIAGLRDRISLRGLDDRRHRRAAGLYAVSLVVWSLAAAAHAFAESAVGFALRGSRWGSAKRATSRRRSRPWPSGSPKENGHLPRASSTRGSAMSARSSRRGSCRACSRSTAGRRRSSPPGSSGLCGSVFWWPIYRPPREHPRCRPPSWRTSKAIRPIRP